MFREQLGKSPHSAERRSVGRTEAVLQRIAGASPWVVAAAIPGVIVLSAGLAAALPGPPAFAFAVFVTAYEFTFFGWLLCLGLYFNSQLTFPPIVSPALPIAAFAFTILYALFCVPLVFGQAQAGFPPLLVVAHIAAMVANFFLLWFACRAIRTFELGHRASLYDYAGPFFLVWLLHIPVPIGPYLIQSRSRQLVEAHAAAQQSVAVGSASRRA